MANRITKGLGLFGALKVSGTFTMPSGSTLKMASGSTLDLSALGVGTGVIQLPMNSWRAIATNDIPAKAVASGSGGALAKDTVPIHERINAATDKAERLSWVATDVTEIAQSIILPPDFPTGAVANVKLLLYKSGNVDTTETLAVGWWEGKGGSNLGANTPAINITSTVTLYTVPITTVVAYPNVVAVTLTPGAHADDALYMLGSWVEFAKKTT